MAMASNIYIHTSVCRFNAPSRQQNIPHPKTGNTIVGRVHHARGPSFLDFGSNGYDTVQILIGGLS